MSKHFLFKKKKKNDQSLSKRSNKFDEKDEE